MKRFYLSNHDRYIAGVCGGLGEYFDIDPTIIRILAVIFGLMGWGIIAYLICWLIAPPRPLLKPFPEAKSHFK